jgi:hypothetical protein
LLPFNRVLGEIYCTIGKIFQKPKIDLILHAVNSAQWRWAGPKTWMRKCGIFCGIFSKLFLLKGGIFWGNILPKLCKIFKKY